MPYTILVDNGSPWSSDLDHPFTPLTVWMIQLGIRVVHSRPCHRDASKEALGAATPKKEQDA